MMLNKIKPRKALNKSFLKIKPFRPEIEKFKSNLITLLDRINDSESEEFHKNLVIDFLKKTYYDPNHFINTKGRNDLVIHNGATAVTSVGVIIEAKKPANKAEMMTTEKINSKAFQELVLYYLRERITNKNLEVKYLIATNINEWFIFDSILFDRIFSQNKQFVKKFTDFEEGRLSDTKTDFFYKQIAEPFINEITSEIEFTHFNINDYQKSLRNTDKTDDNSLISLFKLLSPEHLLKLPFTNDSNTLDKGFYTELLHIIGLTESKEGGKKIINRNKSGERNSGSILENAIIQIDSSDKLLRMDNRHKFGENTDEQLFNIALELTITWINRILFLKLLEAQLLTYHRGDKKYLFLNAEKITNYDDLNSLFFQVLAKRHEDRNEDVKNMFRDVPYLNSSLFEPTEIEQATIFISNLKDGKPIPILSQTILKDTQGRKRTGELSALEYLFEFLSSYDFASEGSEEIQEDNKTLINASVLGLIFEKINGYKDGSFFTPGFITMYMCRETIRRAVIQKFNDKKEWNCKDIDELYNRIEDRDEANQIVDSIKICDPAVGSGHFLVSALNEMISIKNDLKILQDRDGKRLKEYQVEVVNDELVVTDEDGDLFEYNPANKESQRIQETLFHQKQTIIEKCLFGVDINPNSVKICRLRLWIELLKNSYYKSLNELETLPNIDINIKCGNSLVSRFSLDADLKDALKKSKWTIDSYRIAVDTYRNAESKEQKREMEKLIADIKSDFRSEISVNDPKIKKLGLKRGELFNLTKTKELFDEGIKETKKWKKQVSELTAEINKLEDEIDGIKNNKIFENAFEWRFEFPEVLNNDGDYVGFDVVIGNPPYIEFKKLNVKQKKQLEQTFQTAKGKYDLFIPFIELSNNIGNAKSLHSYILPSMFIKRDFGKEARRFIAAKFFIINLIDFTDYQVFEEATVFPFIYVFSKQNISDNTKVTIIPHNKYLTNNLVEDILNGRLLNYADVFKKAQTSINTITPWNINNSIKSELLDKLVSNHRVIRLKEITEHIFVGIQSGMDSVFFLKEEDILYNNLERELLHPILKGKDVNKYSIQWSNTYVIYPYTKNNELIKENELQNKYPNIYTYLLSKKEELSQREYFNKSNKVWYELWCERKFSKFEQRKIINAEICPENRFTIDDNKYLGNTKTFSTVLIDEWKEDYEYVLGLLNSKLLNFFHKSISVPKAGGFFEYKTQFIELYPIFNSTKEEKVEIKHLVDSILTIKNQKATENTSDIEHQIDRLIYKIYDLTEEEIKIVENNS
jgi:hypothetical protein